VRLIHRDPKTGVMKLRLETPSDLWRVTRLVQPGDRVGASTTRRDPEVPLDTPAAQRERRRVWLVINAEEVEFHGFTRHVRITGPIVEGPFDLGRHHTLDLGEGDELSVQKEHLTGGERAILDEALEGRGEPTVLLAAVDWGESSIVRLRGRAIEPVADLNRTLAGKQFAAAQGEKDRGAYLEEILGVILREAATADLLVVAGPGFLKESVAKALSERAPALRAKLKVFSASESGRSGINELLRSGRASEALRGSVAAEEAALVERLVNALGGGRRAAVGLGEVAEAASAGAVETMLVSESLLTDAKALAAMDAAREGRARLFVVRDDGEAGKRLGGLGRIGALLRYDWSSSGESAAGKRGA
jgi:protein pelota